MTENKNPVGRPTKYRAEYNITILEMFKAGASIKDICLEMDIDVDTFYEWKKVHPEFSEAVKKGIDFSQGWWERNGRINLFQKEFNHVLWMMNMKCRFKKDWRDTEEEKKDNSKEEIDKDRELVQKCKTE